MELASLEYHPIYFNDEPTKIRLYQVPRTTGTPQAGRLRTLITSMEILTGRPKRQILNNVMQTAGEINIHNEMETSSIPISIQQNGRMVDVGTIHGVHQRDFVLRLGQNGTPDRISPLPEPFSFSFPHHEIFCLHSG
jgi:hypothetical protein